MVRVEPGVAAIMKRACACRTAVPAFNIPYLPMMEPVVRALRDTGSAAVLLAVLMVYEGTDL